MTFFEILRVLHMVCYLIVVSQLLFYFTVMGNALRIGSLESFLENRKIIDTRLVKRIKIPYYTCLLLNILVVPLSVPEYPRIIFLSALLALVCLVLDAIIALKYNIPLNNLTNQWPDNPSNANWHEVRTKWLNLINYRAVFTTIGMISLIVGAILD